MNRFINKHVSSAVAIVILSLASFSCEQEGDSFGISTVTHFPSFELTDGDRVVLTTGSSFTPDAIVKEGENVLVPTITNNVNNATPGIYAVSYSAENSDGYTGSAIQQVIVYNPAIVATDVTGNIADTGRPERKGVITLVPGTTNIFYCTDMAYAGTFPLYFQMDGDVMTAIPQSFALGVESVDCSYDPVTKQFSIVVNPDGFDYKFKYE